MTWYRAATGYRFIEKLQMASATVKYILEAVCLSTHQFYFDQPSLLAGFCGQLPTRHYRHFHPARGCKFCQSATANDDHYMKLWGAQSSYYRPQYG